MDVALALPDDELELFALDDWLELDDEVPEGDSLLLFSLS
ncbi:hypothetical protein AUR04nite_29570 [Glutamicibacter uratoxydans]|uniref:Uncharacterized protein n=1 Tax=Glutamicibacter uratoxydans TaxID=43667 RepID=A0A4Y4DUZ3_GLUUR|nr:hypothetical protein AUR04nite_29570 [Glutamicibacter uratoxydans]